jgi:asparagine synthase (glutamine-hydrolysing)
MCGVVGVVSRDRPVDGDRIRRALAAIRHRGPDGEGVFVSPDGRAGLGHVRLAVVDVEGGAQPIASEDGGVVAVVNGELYEADRARRALEARGHRFRTRSDSELLVHLYEEHGDGCLEHLRGEFALVLWDERRRRLLCARDRFGVKPLCFAEHQGALFVASEAKALFALGVPAAWDEASLFHATQMQYPLPGSTLFRGVRELEPGTVLVAEGGRVRRARYWDLDYPLDSPSRRAADDAPSAILSIREALEEAVRLRLAADVPVCFQLSGGVDSSAVVALAAPHLRQPAACFTVRFDDAVYDELPIAERTAAHLGATLHAVDVPRARLLDALPAAVAHGEGLAINGHIAAKYLLSRAVRDAGYKVVLTGEGSDEIFAGYAHLRRDLGTPAHLADTNRASAGLMLPEGEALPLDGVRAILGFVPSWLEAKATLGHRVSALLTEDFAARFQGADAPRAFLDAVDVAGQLQGRARVDQSLYLWCKTALAGYILRTLGDGMEMAHGVEGRVPFLDHRLFEVARSLPMPLKIQGGTVEKWGLREALRGLLPEEVRTRQKHPFLAPPFCLAAAPEVQDILRSERWGRTPFFDRRKVAAALDALPALSERERVAQDPALMLAATAGILHASYGL